MEAARLFSERFGTLPDVVVRAPGRVNLVGEHTDYAGLPVLPFAIDRSVTVAAGPAGRVEGWSDAFGPAGPPWWRYVEQALAVAGDPGVRLAVAGDLPHEGGLSSSSALTVGVLAACDLLSSGGIDRESMVERALRAERGMGVEGGAMDQTVITFARPGSALRIDFDPPRLLPVVIPEEVRVVVAYSGTPAPKAGAARDAYNRSVLSTRVAAALLAAESGADPGDPPMLSRVRDASPQAVAALPEEISCRAAAAGLGRHPSSLARMTAGSADLDAPLPVGPVARHVLSEAGRVDRAIAALEAVDGPALGRVLDGSHASLAAGGYSTPDLDRLVEAMRASGAWGARLTGAGFGGYAVAVAPQPVVSAVVAAAVAATGGPAFEVRPSGGVDRA